MTKAKARRLIWRMLHDELRLYVLTGLPYVDAEEDDRRRLREAAEHIRKELLRRGAEPVGRR